MLPSAVLPFASSLGQRTQCTASHLGSYGTRSSAMSQSLLQLRSLSLGQVPHKGTQLFHVHSACTAHSL